MSVAFALAIFAASTAVDDAQAVKPFPVAILCSKTAEHGSGGSTKICYYRCEWLQSGRENTNARAMTAKNYEHCPHLVPRWRLNHNKQFGPSADSR